MPEWFSAGVSETRLELPKCANFPTAGIWVGWNDQCQCLAIKYKGISNLSVYRQTESRVFWEQHWLLIIKSWRGMIRLLRYIWLIARELERKMQRVSLGSDAENFSKGPIDSFALRFGVLDPGLRGPDGRWSYSTMLVFKGRCTYTLYVQRGQT